MGEKAEYGLKGKEKMERRRGIYIENILVGIFLLRVTNAFNPLAWHDQDTHSSTKEEVPKAGDV